MSKKRLLRWALGLTMGILAVAFIAYRWYIASLPERYRAAEAKARAFCEAIAIGSEISAAIAKANAAGVIWKGVDGYAFYFPATPLDKAVCEVSVSNDGRVVSKKSQIEGAYD